MRERPINPMSSVVAGAICAAALAVAGSALAQTTVEELTVVGKAPNEQSVSYVVGFSDLNLRDEGGRKELSHRINLAATYVCHKLGESQANSVAACRGKAIEDAMVQARAIEHDVRAHGGHLKPGRPWVPPGK